MVQIDIDSQPRQSLLVAKQWQAPTSNGQTQQITNTAQGNPAPKNTQEAGQKGVASHVEASKETVITGEVRDKLNEVIAKLDLAGRDEFYSHLIAQEIPFWKSRQKTNFGGSRFLFLCPRCLRRTAKLYLPSGGIHFRCRICYRLTYQSCNDSHKFDAMFANLAQSTGVPFSQVKNILSPKNFKA